MKKAANFFYSIFNVVNSNQDFLKLTKDTILAGIFEGFDPASFEVNTKDDEDHNREDEGDDDGYEEGNCYVSRNNRSQTRSQMYLRTMLQDKDALYRLLQLLPDSKFKRNCSVYNVPLFVSNS